MAYSYYKALTIDYTKCGTADSTDFPMLVLDTDADLKIEGNGGKVKNANGYDIAYYSDSALTTQLKHEVESYNASTGAVIHWVKIPTLSASANTVIYRAYGDAGISTSQADPTNVWDSNFQWVNHFGDGSTVDYNDSTANNYDATKVNTPAASTGKIHGAIRTASSGSKFATWNHTYGDFSGNFTFSMWMNLVNSASGNGDFVFGQAYGGTDLNVLYLASTDQKLRSQIRKNNGTPSTTAAIGTALSTSTWYHIVYQMDTSDNWYVYINGTQYSGTHTSGQRMSEAISGTVIRIGEPNGRIQQSKFTIYIL